MNPSLVEDRSVRTPSSVGVLVLVAAVAMTAGEGGAEDTVILRGQDGRDQVRSVEQVVDFTGKGLVVRHRSGREETIDAARVLEVRSDWCQEHQRGNAEFEQGKFAAAVTDYLQSLSVERRDWVSRLILARCVMCYRAVGDVGRASEAFLAIYRQDPATVYFDTIPLAWMAAAPSPDLERRARGWLDETQPPAARLIAASWLLATSERARSVQIFRRLLSDPQAELAFLAETQLWRTQVVTASPEDADRWQARVARMPAPLRRGPYLLVGQLLSRHKRHQEAALAFLKTAILYPERRELGDEALLAAGRELAKLGRQDEAQRLYEEIVTRFPQSESAREAERLWKELAK